jgi:type III secretory pathway component EscS
MSGEKTMQENTLPWVIKLVPAVVGAILALVLSGDIDKEGKFRSR